MLTTQSTTNGDQEVESVHHRQDDKYRKRRKDHEVHSLYAPPLPLAAKYNDDGTHERVPFNNVVATPKHEPLLLCDHRL